MDNVNIFFLTNKKSDLDYFKSLPHLKEYSIEIEQGIKCFLIDNFAFAEMEGSYRIYDELLESDEVTAKNKMWQIIEEVKNKVFGAGYKKMIFAVHWGEKNKAELEGFLKKLNDKYKEKNSVIFSYWGSQSDKHGNIELIKEEIIKWANKNIENKLDELLEAIEIHIKAIGRFNGVRIEPDKETDVVHEMNRISQKLNSLKAKLKIDS